MQQQEAVALLSFGLPDAAAHTATLQALAQRLGEWALLLKLVNGALREQVEAGSPLNEAFAFVNEGLDEEGISAFNLEHQAGRHAAVDRTMALSLRLLSSAEQARYAELAVFPEDTDVPLATVTRYWQTTGALSGFKAQRLCGKLARLSLLLRYDLAAKTIRLHDVVRSYLQHTHMAHLPTLHAALLDAHRPADGWSTLPADEPYLWHHLAEHLADAGRTEELAALLTDFTWLQAKLDATEPNALLADYDALEPLPEPHILVRKTLWMSGHVLAADITQLAAQLHGRMAGFDDPAIVALLARAAEQKTGPWLRPLHACLTPPDDPLIRTFTGHSKQVNSVAVLPDGQRALSASDDTTLKLWNLATGECLLTFEGHSRWVKSVAVLPDGQCALSASRDTTLKLWDLTTGDCLRTFKGHHAVVESVAVLPDGQRALSGSSDETLKLWDLTTEASTLLLKGHSDEVMSVALLADGQRVLSASVDETLKLWDIATGECLHTFAGHRGSVLRVALLADGQRALSASRDHTLKLWDLATGACLRTLEGHSAGVMSVALLADGQHALSASSDKTLKLWDIETGDCLRTLEGHGDWVRSVALLADGQRVLSASYDKTLKLWDLQTGECLHTFAGHSGIVWSLAVLPDEQRALSASDDTTLKLWDLMTGTCLRTFKGNHAVVESVAVLPDGQRALSASRAKTLKLWDIATGACLSTFYGDSPFQCCAVAADGRTVVAGDAAGVVYFLRLEGLA
jgi:WD40 repeat protein